MQVLHTSLLGLTRICLAFRMPMIIIRISNIHHLNDIQETLIIFAPYGK
jgi:hypothetical protein